MNQTLVISAFPACGKSYFFKHNQDKFSTLDSDSSEFSWVKDKDGKNTKQRNPNFPQNYIDHILSNIGKVDITFVSSHEIVRKALAENKIKTIIIYPNKCLKTQWIKRFKERGNDEGFIKFISDNWDNFIDDIENENYGFIKKRLDYANSYIDIDLIHSCFNLNMGN